MSVVAERIMSLLSSMNETSLDTLPPAHRRQFAQLCRHWAQIAEKETSGVTAPKVGVLHDLHNGAPRHE